jgi:DNA-binding transcriptional MerR regulator
LALGQAAILNGMADSAAQLTIGRVAERTGLSVHALRFYERQGLLAEPVRRGRNGHRLYSEDDVEWLTLCTRFRAAGMPLSTIRRYADLVRQGPGNEADRLALLRRHQDAVASQIRVLTECLDAITYKVTVYQDHLDRGSADRLWSTPSLPGNGDQGEACRPA